MFCESCGAEINDGALFCSACGKKIAKTTEIKTVESKPLISIDKEQLKNISNKMTKKTEELREVVIDAKDDITAKLTELDRMLEESITEYNDAYTLMNDAGMQLYVERCRSIDSIDNVQSLINSISNHPKTFDKDFEEISINRKAFSDACEFAEREVQAAREAAGGAGVGLATGASVAFMAPTAAMWIATTFGTASTGTAISTLSGAAATKAALAWLGGGTLASGGAGVAGGQAFLALAGPVGWTIAGASLLTSILLFSKNKAKLNKEKNEEISVVKRNTEIVKEMDAQIQVILTKTSDIRKMLNESYRDCLPLFKGDYNSFSDKEKANLGAIVNLTKSLTALYGEQVTQEGAES